MGTFLSWMDAAADVVDFVLAPGLFILGIYKCGLFGNTISVYDNLEARLHPCEVSCRGMCFGGPCDTAVFSACFRDALESFSVALL